MGLNDTPNSERVHVSFFGKRNAGKSSLVNRVVNQEMSVVSNVPGTTTDPVNKAMELLPVGPVLITDTPGFDDEGDLGEKRVEVTQKTLDSTDVAVLVIDASDSLAPEFDLTGSDLKLTEMFKEKNIPYIIAYNKADLLMPDEYTALIEKTKASENELYVSAKNSDNIFELKELIGDICCMPDKKPIVSDLINEGDYVVLVVPIDSAAPKGRLILPQQQVIRDILDKNAKAIVIKENEIVKTLGDLSVKPAIVITDSQVFERAAEDTPADIPLTSFSILMARYKGFLDMAAAGAKVISELKDGDTVLIAEGCTHHRQCGDIGTEKLPNMIRQFTGRDIQFEFFSGKGFPKEIKQGSLMIHCGGCMLNEKEVTYRMKKAQAAGIPVTNYGTAIAYMKGILERSMKML